MSRNVLVMACPLITMLVCGCGSKSNPTVQPVTSATTFSLSNTLYDFGGDIVGNTVTAKVVTVTNTGANPLILAPAIHGDPGFSLVVNGSCGTQIPAGGSCKEVVSYAPTAASAPQQQTAALGLNPANATAGTPTTIGLTGISGTLTPGTVTATKNPLVALYTITPPFAGTVTIRFGKDTTYGLTTSAQATPEGGGATSILVAGMQQNTTYQMQATITFSNGTTATDANQSFTTGSYAAGLIPQTTTTIMPGQMPQPGIEILNPCCSNPSLQLLAVRTLQAM